MISKLYKNKIFIIIFVLVLAMLPWGLAKTAQTEERSVVIGMGIDKLTDSEDMLELSAQIIVPHYDIGFNENAQVISAIGSTVAEAFERLNIHIGKIMGLSHCSVIVIGSSMQNENIVDSLDWFYRSKRLDSNAALIYTREKAKEILQTSLQVDNNLSLSLNNILQFNRPLAFAIKKQIIPFLTTYYNGYGAELVPIVDLVEEDYLGLSVKDAGSGTAGSGGGGGQSSGFSGGGSSSANEQKYLSNNGDSAIFKNGKLVTVINSEQVRGFNNILGEAQKGTIDIKNITDDVLTNATLSLSKRALFRTYTIGFSPTGKPRIEYHLDYRIRTEQIQQKYMDRDILNSENDNVTEPVKKAVISYVKGICADAVNISKEYNVDCFNIYDTFDRLKHKEWQEYLASLENKDDYMQDVEFFVDIVVSGVD